MSIEKDEHKSVSFSNISFENFSIKDDILIIEANEKYFIFEYDTVINMIDNFNPKEQDYIRRRLQLYNYLNLDLSICLMQIAANYVGKSIEEHYKKECKILPLHSFYTHI
ncbi:hypothetical protein FC694_27575 [Bacillus wiedmannii]|uniref:Uncharacterized protein n=1 Tax=Bacillus wiedmannii TaxID=1890302 RepID=A0A4U2MFQ7_9BACI|nr:hypothetical protein [Bacillus wiedmannii]TKH09733.1 hypothetical protein FC694_27575 [Bacillus wiedmannii]